MCQKPDTADNIMQGQNILNSLGPHKSTRLFWIKKLQDIANINVKIYRIKYNVKILMSGCSCHLSK